MPETPDERSTSTGAESQEHFNEAEFLRRTFDRSLQEMERSRTYFEKLLTHAKWYISVVTAVGFSLIALLGFRSWSDVESRINAAMDKVSTDIKTKGQKTIDETDTEIRDKARQAFEQNNLKTYIREVAKEKTEQGLAAQINRAVNEQVAHQVASEQPEISRTVVSETKKAVDSLSPSISSNISSEVKKQSTEALNPLRQEVAAYRDFLKVSTLAIEARNGDGNAFDELERLGKTPPNPEIQQICVSTINDIYVEMNGAIYPGRTFNEPKTKEQLAILLNDPNPLNRWAAVDGLSNQNAKEMVPDLITIINQDSSLWVRRAAYQALQQLTRQKFDKLAKETWNSWWTNNKNNWPAKQ